MSRRLRSAVELVSHIGELGFDLYHHDEKDIAEAVKTLWAVNPQTFKWLVQALQAPLVADAAVFPRDERRTSDGPRAASSSSNSSHRAAAVARSAPPTSPSEKVDR